MQIQIDTGSAAALEVETNEYLKTVLRGHPNVPILIEVKIGKGEAVIQRVRVQLSRVRRKLLNRGVAIRNHFKLKASVERDEKKGVDVITFLKTMKAGEIVLELGEIEKFLTEEVKTWKS